MEILTTPEGLLILSFLALAISMWILYEIIKSATKSQTEATHMLCRLKIKEMKRQGFTHEELKKIYEQSDADFWTSVAEEN